jgi:hypothetical protein
MRQAELGGGPLAEGGGARPEDRVGGARVTDHLVVGARGLQRAADLAHLGRGAGWLIGVSVDGSQPPCSTAVTHAIRQLSRRVIGTRVSDNYRRPMIIPVVVEV